MRAQLSDIENVLTERTDPNRLPTSLRIGLNLIKHFIRESADARIVVAPRFGDKPGIKAFLGWKEIKSDSA